MKTTRNGTISLLEGFVLMMSIGLIVWCGASAYRWMWAQAELLSYRSTMQGLTSTVQAMRAQALAKRQTVQLRVDASRGLFQLALVEGHRNPYAVVQQTIWLPKGLEISDAPEMLSALPSGRLSPASIVIAAPFYNRFFRLTMKESGVVRWDEESAL